MWFYSPAIWGSGFGLRIWHPGHPRNFEPSKGLQGCMRLKGPYPSLGMDRVKGFAMSLPSDKGSRWDYRRATGGIRSPSLQRGINSRVTCS